MKRKTTKFIAVALSTVAICVLGLHLSQNNEYKKFLELNKKALAEDKEHMFGNGIHGKCSSISGKCIFICPRCGYESDRMSSLGDPYELSGICIFCSYTPFN